MKRRQAADTGAGARHGRTSKTRQAGTHQSPRRFEILEDRNLLSVTGRHLFYNQSAFDDNNAAIDPATDDAAIAIDKVAYRPDASFTINRITNNTTTDTDPRVYGNIVVWHGTGGIDGGTDNEIFMYDGNTITQLTQNTVHDRFPKVSALGIIWDRNTGTNQDIIYWNGVSETVLGVPSVLDTNAVISDQRIAWDSGAGTGFEILSWTPGGGQVELTDNSIVDRFPAIDGDDVVWVGGSVPNNVVNRSNAGGAPVPVNGNGTYSTTFAINDPQLSGPKVVWEGFRYGSADASGREIYMDNGTSVIELTNNTYSDFDPQIDGDNVVWWGGVFNNFQIYLYDGNTVQPISSGLRNQFPQIDGDYVVWTHFDGQDDEIFWWNGHEAIQLTDNTVNDSNPRISGNHVVWQSMSGSNGTTLEIYEATLGYVLTDFNNVSSYSRGINGLMVDIAGHTSLTANDFAFKVGNNNTPASWAAAPAPNAITVRGNFDGSGTDRVEFTWANNVIENQWLEVRVLATAGTGLASDDVFYFGNKIGDVGNPTATSFSTTAAGDATPIVSGGLGPANGITDVRDIDRSNVITAAGDRGAAVSNIGAIVRLKIAPPAPLLAPTGGKGDAGIASALSATSGTAGAAPQSAPALVANSPSRVDATDARVAAYFSLLAESAETLSSLSAVDDDSESLDELFASLADLTGEAGN